MLRAVLNSARSVGCLLGFGERPPMALARASAGQCLVIAPSPGGSGRALEALEGITLRAQCQRTSEDAVAGFVSGNVWMLQRSAVEMGASAGASALSRS